MIAFLMIAFKFCWIVAHSSALIIVLADTVTRRDLTGGGVLTFSMYYLFLVLPATYLIFTYGV